MWVGKEKGLTVVTKKNTITINGRQYDARSGLPVEQAKSISVVDTISTAPVKPISPRIDRHPVKHNPKSTSRSQTLRRDLVEKPKGTHANTSKRTVPQRAKVAQSPHIQKFAPHPVATSKPTNKHTSTKPNHQTHSKTVTTAHARHAIKKPAHQTHTTHAHQTAKQASAALSSRELKDQMIARSLEAAIPQKATAKHKKTRQPLLTKPLRASSVMAGSMAIVMLGGYLTYINMPDISTRVAASQSGVEASYPGYKPDGYRFKGPVAYDEGTVTVSFASNSGPQNFSINQSNSNWDSETVLDSYVAPKTTDYTANTSQGVTVYTYNDGAAWVNGGVFYTLDGDATLSTEQVLRIANSM